MLKEALSDIAAVSQKVGDRGRDIMQKAEADERLAFKRTIALAHDPVLQSLRCQVQIVSEQIAARERLIKISDDPYALVDEARHQQEREELKGLLESVKQNMVAVP